jgi:hypothetical protein
LKHLQRIYILHFMMRWFYSICTAVRDAKNFISHQNELPDISYKWETTKCRIFQKNFLFWPHSLYFVALFTQHFITMLQYSLCRSEDTCTKWDGLTDATRRTMTNELAQSWDANSFSASLEIPRALRTRKSTTCSPGPATGPYSELHMITHSNNA